MENATKALIMAGTVLISILLISFLVLFLRKGASASAEYYNAKNDEELARFNAQFEVYDRNDNVYADIISVKNLADNINSKNDSSNKITINVYKNSRKTELLSLDEIYKNAPEYSSVIKKDGKIQNEYNFVCNEIKYNDLTGKVNLMEFIIKKNT